MTTTYSDVAHLNPEQKRALLEQPLREKARKADVFPLSFAQRRLWFLDKLQPGTAAYNVPTVVRLKGAIHLDAFRKGLNAAVARHDALRATFSAGGDEPVQKITASADVSLRLIDLTEREPSQRQTEADRIIGEEVRKPFALTTDPMIRATLVRSE